MGLESKDENKTIVRRWIELWNTKGADGVDDVFAPDFRDPQLEQRLGIDGPREFDEQEMLSEGDRVMVRWTRHASGTALGSASERALLRPRRREHLLHRGRAHRREA